jgi:hypothetical protein
MVKDMRSVIKGVVKDHRLVSLPSTLNKSIILNLILFIAS